MASPMTAGLPALRYITRMDYDRNHGWWVRIPAVRPLPGEPRLNASKLFSDSVWGGKEKALAAAQRWRREILRQFPRPEEHRYRSTVEPGHGYIRFVMKRYPHRKRNPNPRQPAWAGWLRVENRQSRETSASIDRWGREEAFQRVEQWLEKERRALAARLGITYAKLMQQARKRPYLDSRDQEGLSRGTVKP